MVCPRCRAALGSRPRRRRSPCCRTARRRGGRRALSADLASPEAPGRLVQAARDAFGHLDIVVANHARSSTQSLEELTAEELDMSFAVNTRATLLLAKAFAAQHDGRPGGRVVLFTSGQYHGAMPSELAYVASKGAFHQLTASLAAHLMPRGITTASTRAPTTPATPPTRSAGRSPPGYLGAVGGPLRTPPASWPGWSVTKPDGSRAR
jgi:NAD(P)-dependent dehydrogenase (short-subunit alcohol dehydrogenase family)